jgi:ATP-dependent RNA helicase DDX3X
MSWQDTTDMAVALPEATSNGWGTDANAAPDGAWGADASGDAGGDAEAEAPRPSYTPAGITKTPGEHGWADKKDAAYDYATFSKSNRDLADAAAAREEAEGQASAEAEIPVAEPVGAVGGLLPGQWSSNAAVYEWNEEYGDVGPAFADLEKQLFGSEFHVRQGIQFDQ